MAKPRAPVLGGRLRRRGKKGKALPTFNAAERDQIWVWLRNLGQVPKSKIEDKREDTLNTIDDIFAVYLGMHRAGPPPKESERKQAITGIKIQAGALGQMLDAARPDELQAIEAATAPKPSIQQRLAVCGHPGLSLLRRQLDAVFDAHASVGRKTWMEALLQSADDLQGQLLSCHVSDCDILHRAMRRRAEYSGQGTALTLRHNLALLANADLAAVRLPKAAMDQPGDRLIADLAHIWHDAVGRPPLRRMIDGEVDWPDDADLDDDAADLDPAEYDAMLDSLAEQEEYQLFGCWIRQVLAIVSDKPQDEKGSNTSDGVTPPSIRRIRKIAALQDYSM